MSRTRIPFSARCDRRSFVGNFRCDRAASSTGRCNVHNQPWHKNALAWDDPAPTRKDRRKGIIGATTPVSE